MFQSLLLIRNTTGLLYAYYGRVKWGNQLPSICTSELLRSSFSVSPVLSLMIRSIQSLVDRDIFGKNYWSSVKHQTKCAQFQPSRLKAHLLVDQTFVQTKIFKLVDFSDHPTWKESEMELETSFILVAIYKSR